MSKRIGTNFSSFKTVIIKLGTSLMTDSQGRFSRAALKRIVFQISGIIRKHDLNAVIVSSGAIGLGMEVLGLKRRPKELSTLQACAAIGQGKLMHLYEETFSKKGYHTAQVLLTRDEFEERKLYLNAHRTLMELIGRRIIPIVNENDTIATQEIQLGDNDTLAALVSLCIKADLTILLSDVEGFFLEDRSRVDLITGLHEIEELKGHLYVRSREHTVGGMATKLNAAKMLLQSGLSLLIADGRDAKILEKILKGRNVGTLFLGSGRILASHKSWLAHSARISGAVYIDEGAAEAVLKCGKSLLARGVVKTEGTFDRRDAVRVLRSQDKCVIGVGKINYTHKEMEKIIGKRTDEIAEILGTGRRDEVIHRDHWVPLNP